ncbi:MAG: methionyl-tRNA formyltransferase [Deltaproteobacteria bacterium]|nr:methionyl-tRNA formyltransferase [Deltaproteobacteria bacterium]
MTGVSKDAFPADPGLIFMGTPEFAIPTLKGLVNNGHKVLAVVTQPDRPKGRGRKMTASPVKKFAVEHNIETLQPESVSDDGFCNLIKKKAPDLIIVIAFGQILKKDLLAIPKWGVINIHASLLPKYRGAAPIQRAILNNESKTGLTVMRMDEGLDTGSILYQEEVPIHRDETAGQLHDRLARIAGDLMIRSLSRMAEEPIEERPQDHSRATYAPKIERSISLIDWQQDAEKISALVRALDPRPGAYTIIQGKEIKLFSTGVLDEDHLDVIPGRVVKDSDEGLIVETGKGLIKIREMQYPGKKRLSSNDFLRGFSLPEGTILGK